MSAKKWHDNKYAMLVEPHEKQEMNKLLMGYHGVHLPDLFFKIVYCHHLKQIVLPDSY